MAVTNPSAVSSKGKVLQVATESTFNIAPGSGYKDVRVEGEPAIAPPVQTAVPVNTLTSNPYDGEVPKTTSQFVDDAVVYTTVIRPPTTPGTDPHYITGYKSGGYQIANSDDTTVTTGATTTSIPVTDNTNVAGGEGCHIELPSGKYIPMLAAGGGGTLTPSMALPEVPADAAIVLGAHTVSPGSPGSALNTLTFRHWNQMKDQAGSNHVYHQATGCALASVGDLVVERGTLPVVEFTYRAAQITRGSNASFPVNSFQDGVGIQVWDDVLCGFAASAVGGAIAETYYSVIKATFAAGVETTAIPEAASDTDNGGLCGHMSNPTDSFPMLTLEIKADEARMDDWETDGGVSKYISLVQYGTAASPGTGIFCPTAKLIEQPTYEPYGQGYEKVTLVYRCFPAAYTDSVNTASDQQNQPFYIVGPADRS
jgi:hypothetical protein